jgi:aryl-alcohol dehydrogenase-like predicted oxidoreductase
VPELKKRRLGRTGLVVAELGLGTMDTPHSPEGAATLRTALDLGIDFVDTAREYEGSEFLIGQLVRERGRKDFHVATKTFSHTVDGSQRDVDRSLSMLGVERIDLYQLHDISTAEAWERVMQDDGALAGLQIAKYRGLIDHIGVSSHSLDVLREAITCGEFEAVMVEYSAFFPESAPLIEFAVEHDVGVIVMRPLGGSGRTSAIRGRIADGYDGPLTPANLLRYVLSNRGVSVAIPGARYPSRIHENVATAFEYEPMDAAERRALEAEAAQLY